MTRTILIAAEEPAACPKCSHRFPLAEGLSRQAIERHAEEHEKALAQDRRALEAELAAQAKRRAESEFEVRLKAAQEAAAAKDAALTRFRAEELELRRQLNALA